MRQPAALVENRTCQLLRVTFQNYRTTMQNVEPWSTKIDVCRNFTTACAPLYNDGHFDFIYVDVSVPEIVTQTIASASTAFGV